jgi:hypothetical protein
VLIEAAISEVNRARQMEERTTSILVLRVVHEKRQSTRSLSPIERLPQHKATAFQSFGVRRANHDTI